MSYSLHIRGTLLCLTSSFILVRVETFLTFYLLGKCVLFRGNLSRFQRVTSLPRSIHHN
jgi:hypothetical protein